jgi:cytochrome c oxidase subunit IV
MKQRYNVHTVWLLMVILTLSTYVVGESGQEGIYIVTFLLLTAMVKGGLIIRDFMELKDVSTIWKIIMYGWLSIVCIVIAVTYIVSI